MTSSNSVFQHHGKLNFSQLLFPSSWSKSSIQSHCHFRPETKHSAHGLRSLSQIIYTDGPVEQSTSAAGSVLVTVRGDDFCFEKGPVSTTGPQISTLSCLPSFMR